MTTNGAEGFAGHATSFPLSFGPPQAVLCGAVPFAIAKRTRDLRKHLSGENLRMRLVYIEKNRTRGLQLFEGVRMRFFFKKLHSQLKSQGHPRLLFSIDLAMLPCGYTV